MIKLIETFTPKTGDPVITTREFRSRNDFKKSLQRSPVATEFSYALLKKGRFDEILADGHRTVVVEEHPKLEIVK